MVELNETTISMAFAVVGVVGSIIWFILGWYGVRTLQDIREAVS
jgi:hypothetical protein